MPFTGCESSNKSRFGWRYWRTAVRMDLLHSTALTTFTGWRRSSTAKASFSVSIGCYTLILPARRVLQSAIAPSTLHACARAWNSLPLSVKSFLFQFSVKSRQCFLPDSSGHIITVYYVLNSHLGFFQFIMFLCFL